MDLISFFSGSRLFSFFNGIDAFPGLPAMPAAHALLNELLPAGLSAGPRRVFKNLETESSAHHPAHRAVHQRFYEIFPSWTFSISSPMGWSRVMSSRPPAHNAKAPAYLLGGTHATIIGVSKPPPYHSQRFLEAYLLDEVVSSSTLPIRVDRCMFDLRNPAIAPRAPAFDARDRQGRELSRLTRSDTSMDSRSVPLVAGREMMIRATTLSSTSILTPDPLNNVGYGGCSIGEHVQWQLQ